MCIILGWMQAALAPPLSLRHFVQRFLHHRLPGSILVRARGVRAEKWQHHDGMSAVAEDDHAERTVPEKLATLIERGGVLDGFAWPDRINQFDIAIRHDGIWTHQGAPIKRLSLCRLFSTVLQRDSEGRYWLVTPGERGEVAVEDAPFLAVEMAVQGTGEHQVLSFRTSHSRPSSPETLERRRSGRSFPWRW